MRQMLIIDGEAVMVPVAQQLPKVISLGQCRVMAWHRTGNVVRYVVVSNDQRFAVLMSVEVDG